MKYVVNNVGIKPQTGTPEPFTGSCQNVDLSICCSERKTLHPLPSNMAMQDVTCLHLY